MDQENKRISECWFDFFQINDLTNTSLSRVAELVQSNDLQIAADHARNMMASKEGFLKSGG